MGVKLGAVDGKHDNYVIATDVTCLDILKIVATREEVVVR